MSKTIIKGYKGFNKDLKCRDFQYEVDKEYHTDGDIKVCDKGFHFCENPLDVWNFYPLVDGNVYHEVIGSGKIDKDENKVSVENIKIGARLDLSSFINASVNFILEKASKKKIFKNVNATSGERANSATSGNYANSATSGYGAHSATIQKNTIACAIGRKAKAKGSLGSFIVIAEWYEGKEFTDAYPLCVLSAKVDNKKVKADTWYKVVKGKFVETDDSNE